MRILLISLFFLTGCVSEADRYQQVLVQYSEAAGQGDLSLLLTGSALHYATQSRDFLTALGWSQRGSSSFTQTQVVGKDRVLSCLDVSGVEFFDSAGERVTPVRSETRILMDVLFTDSNPPKITQLQEAGKC